MPLSLSHPAPLGLAVAGFISLCLCQTVLAGETGAVTTASVKAETRVAADPLRPSVNTAQKAELTPSALPPKEQYEKVLMEPKKPEKVIAVDEQLSYLIKCKGLPAGESVFKVKRKTRLSGKSAFYVTMETESNDAINLLYPVRDKVKSYISEETGFSLRFERSLREGSYKANDKLIFDYDKNEQTYSAIKYKGNTSKEVTKPPIPIPGPVHDPISAMYYLRHFPLKIGESKKLLIGSRKRTDILVVTPIREKEISIPGIGTFDAYLVELSAGDAGGGKYNSEIFFSDGEIKLWVEKHTNIPLMLKVGVPILGEMTAILQSADCSLLRDQIKP